MPRTRLTNRIAADMLSKKNTQVEAKGSGIDNDPYDMNDTNHSKNDPLYDEYAKGDPSAWAEDPHMKNPAVDDDKREETGHAPLVDRRTAAEVVASAKKMEMKAVKCIVASQRMLPGASDDVIEKQAAAFMHIPDFELDATLSRQEDLAKAISKAASESSDDVDEEENEEMKAKKTELDELKKKMAALEEELGMSSDDEDESEESEEKPAKKEDKEEKTAGSKKKDDEDADEMEEEVSMKKAEDDDDETKKGRQPQEEGDIEEEHEASEENLLDSIFNQVISSESKKGASSLAGVVKKEASQNGPIDLSAMWSDRTPPDVSEYFK